MCYLIKFVPWQLYSLNILIINFCLSYHIFVFLQITSSNFISHLGIKTWVVTKVKKCNKS